MIYRFTIPGRLPGMNELIAANRSNPHKGAKLKAGAQQMVGWRIPKGLKVKPPVKLHYCFYEQNRRRDHDNVSGFAHKVVQDALVQAKVLPDDGWNEVIGYSDDFFLDKENPRIEVEIVEVKG